MVWQIRGRSFPSERTLIMAILNVTPDSFSDGGNYFAPEKAVEKALELQNFGADILDLGAESTRPGAEEISEAEELNRLIPVLEQILAKAKINIPISIDTTKAAVAEVCLKKGAHIINDVSGLEISGERMAKVVKDYGAGLILMHRRGTPQTMQDLTQYQNVTEDVLAELEIILEKAREWGIDERQIVVDPGFGFSKTAEQNLELLANFEKINRLGRPVLAGVSRKSFLGLLTGKPAPERDWATASASAIAVQKGAAIVRVHEPSGMQDVVRVAEACRNLDSLRLSS